MTPFIVTFYSYKGGVGRSILAANVAALLARSGKTLLWDLDIEAPGLHRVSDLASTQSNERGLFEWLLDWQTHNFDPPNAAACKKLGAMLLPVERRPNLYLLPAHGAEARFARQYQEINWQRFLADEPSLGIQLFRKLIDWFASAAGGGFRYIVLDSRTGITDIGGLLAAVLPHATVLVGNYGAQNTGGLREIWEPSNP
jgi:cellulose biosynthesis protein BcsQ